MVVSLIAFIGVFSIIVLVHELGHFIAAKAAGMRVYEFSIGFPFSPKIMTLFRYRETEFTLRAFPLGGFVRFVKNNGEGACEWFRTSCLKRMFVMSAGSLVNILFAFLVFAAIAMVRMNFGPVKAAMAGGLFTWYIVSETARFLSSLLSGNGGMDAFFGPIGIASIAWQAAHQGLLNVLLLTGVLSLSLGIMNLMPLPAFDGGQIIIITAESIRKAPFQIKVYQTVNTVGLAMVLALAAIATYQDILRLIQ